MDPSSQESAAELAEVGASSPSHAWTTISLVGSVYVMLLAIGMIGSGFKWATGDEARQLFEFASNPFMGLVIGTVATALIQSSSTVSSIVVGLVGGGLPVATAVPIIMGANMGTTITNTLVSLGHVRDRDEFRRAFSAATVHDFFNLISVVIFLPLEIMFHPLERIGGMLAASFTGTGGGIGQGDLNVVKAITAPLVGLLKIPLGIFPEPFGGVAMALLGVTFIFVAIHYIGKLLKSVMVGRAKAILHAAIGRGPMSGIASGTLITVLVQSSSTTTSLMVPLAGAGLFSVRDIYPFTLGANIGTCITALIAAMGVTGVDRTFALQIALVHLTYNVLGVVVIYGLPFLRAIPIQCSEWLAELAAKNKLYVIAYVLGVFFVLPLLLIFALH